MKMQARWDGGKWKMEKGEWAATPDRGSFASRSTRISLPIPFSIFPFSVLAVFFFKKSLR
jgi:hypothetical protein